VTDGPRELIDEGRQPNASRDMLDGTSHAAVAGGRAFGLRTRQSFDSTV